MKRENLQRRHTDELNERERIVAVVDDQIARLRPVVSVISARAVAEMAMRKLKLNSSDDDALSQLIATAESRLQELSK